MQATNALAASGTASGPSIPQKPRAALPLPKRITSTPPVRRESRAACAAGASAPSPSGLAGTVR